MQSERRDSREPEGAATGRVLELLPSAMYRVELESRRQVLAHATAATAKNFVRIRPGDRVRLELSPHDPTRGRIMELLDDRGEPA